MRVPAVQTKLKLWLWISARTAGLSIVSGAAVYETTQTTTPNGKTAPERKYGEFSASVAIGGAYGAESVCFCYWHTLDRFVRGRVRAPREVDAVQVEPGGGLEKRNHNHVTKWKSRLDKFSVVFGNLHTAAAHKHGNTFRAATHTMPGRAFWGSLNIKGAGTMITRGATHTKWQARYLPCSLRCRCTWTGSFQWCGQPGRQVDHILQLFGQGVGSTLPIDSIRSIQIGAVC